MNLYTQKIIEQCKEVHNNYYTYPEQTILKKSDKMVIDCKVKGHGLFTQRTAHHLAGHGCKWCKGGIVSDTEDFIKKAKCVHINNEFCYEKVVYVNNYDDIKIFCNKCLNYFYQSPRKHLLKQGCNKCGRYRKIDTTEYRTM